MIFSAYATNFELHPPDGEAAHFMTPLFTKQCRIDFAFRVNDPTVNQGQMDSDFDTQLEAAFLAIGATTFKLKLPMGVPQKLDFAFTFGGRTVAVEVEKANQEKILRDILKCHIYLHSDADFAIVVLPKNFAHKHGKSNLFKFGVERYNECQKYGFGTAKNLGKILLVGFDQREAESNLLLSKAIREEMRAKAAAQPETV